MGKFLKFRLAGGVGGVNPDDHEGTEKYPFLGTVSPTSSDRPYDTLRLAYSVLPRARRR